MSEKMGKFDFLKKISVLGFMAKDLSLYLNTHPDDREALVQYNACLKELKMVKQEYQKCFGMIDGIGAYSPYPWQWIKEPWPWEYEANFRL